MKLWRKNETLVSKPERAPWDNETVSWFADQKSFDVQIISISKSMTCGWLSQVQVEFHASGVMEHPRLIDVFMTFEPPETRTEPFGIFRYGCTPKRVARANEWVTVKLPALQIALNNPNYETATAIFEAHRDALLSGKRTSLVRFWKEEGVGMNDEDKGQDQSWGPYSIFGITLWNTLEADPLLLDRLSEKNL